MYIKLFKLMVSFFSKLYKWKFFGIIQLCGKMMEFIDKKN